MQWFYLNPITKGGLILLFGTLIGYIIYLMLNKFTRGRIADSNATIWTTALRHIWLPIVLTTIAIFADDAVDRAGLNVYFWWEEFIALMQSLPVIAWTWQLIAICRFYFSRLVNQLKEESNAVHALSIISNLIIIFLIVGGAYVILRIWSLDLSPLLTSAGIAGAVAAIASRDSLSDFLGGITIFLDRPYHIGDFVVLTGGERGEVVNIGIRSTSIRTRDDVYIFVPNSVMVSAKILNESSLIPQYRVKCRVGVAYNSDLIEVETVILDSLKDNPFILQEPEPRVRYRNFSDWAVELEVLAWIKDPCNRGFAKDMMIRGIHQAFRDGKIDIPFPQKEITIKNDK
jgi:small-conductance mechanosensitive channel